MLKVTVKLTAGFEPAVLDMRKPLRSEWKSDSTTDKDGKFIIGPNDLALMTKLVKAGESHRKFMRSIYVWTDVEAPLYWWKEMDTYKVGTVRNSDSTMHNIHKKPFELSDFDNDDALHDFEDYMETSVIPQLEKYRLQYLESKNPLAWRSLIKALPNNYILKSSLTLNYETLRKIVEQRRGHKQLEWDPQFLEVVRQLPYAEELLFS